MYMLPLPPNNNDTVTSMWKKNNNLHTFDFHSVIIIFVTIRFISFDYSILLLHIPELDGMSQIHIIGIWCDATMHSPRDQYETETRMCGKTNNLLF